MAEEVKKELRYEEQFFESSSGDQFLQSVSIYYGDLLLTEMQARTVEAMKAKLQEGDKNTRSDLKARLKTLGLSNEEWEKITEQVVQKILSYERFL